MAPSITLDQSGPCPSEMTDVITASFSNHKPTPGETELAFQMTSKTRIATHSLHTQRARPLHRNAWDKDSYQHFPMQNCGSGWCVIGKTRKLIRKGSRWNRADGPRCSLLSCPGLLIGNECSEWDHCTQSELKMGPKDGRKQTAGAAAENPDSAATGARASSRF